MLSHEPGEGVRESEYLLTNNISTGPCISPYCPNMVELPNQMCGGMFADTVTSPSEETIPQLLSCLISKYLTPCITLRRCPVKFPLVDTNYQNSRLGSGEGNGTPLQYSRLENPMDGGAWWAAVHGVAEVRAQLHLTLCNPWTVACQAPLSMEFSRQEYWSRLPLPSPGDLPT